LLVSIFTDNTPESCWVDDLGPPSIGT